MQPDLAADLPVARPQTARLAACLFRGKTPRWSYYSLIYRGWGHKETVRFSAGRTGRLNVAFNKEEPHQPAVAPPEGLQSSWKAYPAIRFGPLHHAAVQDDLELQLFAKHALVDDELSVFAAHALYTRRPTPFHQFGITMPLVWLPTARAAFPLLHRPPNCEANHYSRGASCARVVSR